MMIERFSHNISRMILSAQKLCSDYLQPCHIQNPSRTCNKRPEEEKINGHISSLRVRIGILTSSKLSDKTTRKLWKEMTYRGTICRKNASWGKGKSMYSIIFNTASDLICDLKIHLKVLALILSLSTSTNL